MKKITLLFPFIIFSVSLTSCEKNTVYDDETIELASKLEPEVELIVSLSDDDLIEIENTLIRENPDVGLSKTPKPLWKESTIRLNIYKLSVPTPHPDGSNRTIQASGVVIVPKIKKQYRTVYNTSFTYVSNAAAPSVFFEDVKINNISELDGIILYGALLQANKGFAIVFPDYLGFGDSLGDCFQPYLNKDAHNRSNYDFYNGAKELLKSEGYGQKEEIILQGYSQGAFSAMQFTKFLDTETDIPVMLTQVGGTPTDPFYIINRAKSQETYPSPYFFPYAFNGWHENNLMSLDPSTVFQEDYLQASIDFFDGSNSSSTSDDVFPQKLSEFLTEDFINADLTDPNSVYFELYEQCQMNSLTPWKNKGKIKMYHGEDDVEVYYEQGKAYYEQHKELYGNIEFETISGDHTRAYIPFFKATTKSLRELK